MQIRKMGNNDTEEVIRLMVDAIMDIPQDVYTDEQKKHGPGPFH
ncbi:hypothetical protein [Halobacillus sp. Cin3]|nr:hypothetical protein [Halobacillus sp. Cin3]